LVLPTPVHQLNINMEYLRGWATMQVWVRIVKSVLMYATKTYGEVEIQPHSFLNLALDGSACSTSRSGHFTPWERTHCTQNRDCVGVAWAPVLICTFWSRQTQPALEILVRFLGCPTQPGHCIQQRQRNFLNALIKTGFHKRRLNSWVWLYSPLKYSFHSLFTYLEYSTVYCPK
jgi:hypothetical protein